jgi:uncharacterized protein
MGRRFLSAAWRHLVMLNYEIDAEILRPLVPQGTILDSWSGRYFVSLVGFQFRKTRVLGIPIPFHRHFEEVNLRFYVRRESAGATQRGVTFIKEVVPRVAIAAAARWLYNENYVACRMSSEVRLPDEGSGCPGSIAYRWAGNSGWNVIGAEMVGIPGVPRPGSEEEFITEHYWGYVSERGGSTLEYRVEHPPWRVWRATKSELAGNVGNFYGEQYREALSRAPSSAFVAEGSEVVVYKGEPLGLEL